MSANGLPMIFNVNGLGDAKFSCTLSVADDGNSFNLNCDGNIMIGNSIRSKWGSDSSNTRNPQTDHESLMS